MTNDTVLTMPVEPAYGGRNNGNGMFGDDGAWWIVLFLIFAAFGWGGNGFGGGFGGGNGGATPYFTSTATQSDIQRGFDNAAVITKLDGITQGICDSTYALNNAITNGFNNTNMNMMQGFNGVDRSICALQAQIAACCCDIERGIDGVNYNLATNTCALQNTIQSTTRDIIDNANANSRAILDFLTQDKIATLTAENQSLKFQASQTAQNAFITANQDAQTAELIRRLGRDCPIPAYVVPNPNCCYGNPLGIGYGYNGGYGNNGNCGCNSCGC